MADELDEPTILLDAYSLVHGDRNGTYGPPSQDYLRTVDLFNAATDRDLSVYEGLLFMVCMKLSRISYGLDQAFPAEMLRDSITDAAGYLDCLWWALSEPDEIDEEPEEGDPDEH